MNNAEKKRNSNQLILTVLAILILIIAVIGVSYAAVFYSKDGEKVNSVTTGSMMMSYSELTNGINLYDAYPMTDEEGKALSQPNEYFDFTVSATTKENSPISYVISVSKESDSTLPDSAIKVYLTDISANNEIEVLPPTNVSALSKTGNESYAPSGQYILKSGSYTKNTSNTYRLRMWIDKNYNLDDSIQSYKLRVNVYGGINI